MTAHELDPVTGFDPYAAQDPEPLARRIVLTPASQIRPRRVRWTWDARIAQGTLSLLAGREGLGKSTLGYWIAARITKGTLPGEHEGTPRPVLVCATEDSWEHTIVPRLIAAGADLDLVYRVEVVTHDGLHLSVSLPRDFGEVDQIAAQIHPALLLVDPLMSVIDIHLDTHVDREVRQALEPLARLADRTDMAILGLIHHNKSGSTDALQLVMGSKAFAAVSRSVHTCIPDPDDETQTRRLFATSKNNLGRTDLPVLGFTITSHAVETDDDGTAWTGRIHWTGEVQGSMHEIMQRSADPERGATAEASDWLRDYLETQGGIAAKADVEKAARAAGHSARTIARARERLRIQYDSSGFPRRTFWTLPETATPPSPVIPASDDWGPEDRPSPLTETGSLSMRESGANQDTLPGTTAKPGDNGTETVVPAKTDAPSRATVVPTLAPLGTTGSDQAKDEPSPRGRARAGRHDVGTTVDPAQLDSTVVPVVPEPTRAHARAPARPHDYPTVAGTDPTLHGEPWTPAFDGQRPPFQPGNTMGVATNPDPPPAPTCPDCHWPIDTDNHHNTCEEP